MLASSAPQFIIQTKLHRPRAVNQLVSLSHAQQRLTHNLDRILTLVSAPAGFGKTTLLGEWLRTTLRPSAWLTLDEHDNDLITFLTYLIAAIRTLFPDACATLQTSLQAADPPQRRVLHALLNNELDCLAERNDWTAGHRFILVLDDYHHTLIAS